MAMNPRHAGAGPVSQSRGRTYGSVAGVSPAGLRVAITGGTSGLGLALVQEFTTRRAKVAFVARTAKMRFIPSLSRSPENWEGWTY